MDEPSEANQTPQSISADISTPHADSSAEPIEQNEAIKALPAGTPQIGMPPEDPLRTAVIKIKEPDASTKTPIEPTPQIEPPISVPKATAIADTTVKARAAIQSKKRKKLDLILEEVRKNGSISNNEVEKLLDVSDATASRYLVTLQKEGSLNRLGKTGKAVRYQLGS